MSSGTTGRARRPSAASAGRSRSPARASATRSDHSGQARPTGYGSDRMTSQRDPFADFARMRRGVELSRDGNPGQAQATYEDGILRVELPGRVSQAARQVPIERAE